METEENRPRGALPRKILLSVDFISRAPIGRDEAIVAYELWRLAHHLVDRLFVEVRPTLDRIDDDDNDEDHWRVQLHVATVRLAESDPQQILLEWEANVRELVNEANKHVASFAPLDGQRARAQVVEVLDWVS